MKYFKSTTVFLYFLILAIFSGMFLAGCWRKQEPKIIRIGVSLSNSEDKFISYIRDGIQEYQESIWNEVDVEVVYMDARVDQEKQNAQVKKFIEYGMDAIIVIPVSEKLTSDMTKMAMKSKVPIVYGNNFPEEFKYGELPKDVYFVGSKEKNGGIMQMEYLADKLGGKGNVAILMGDFVQSATFERTEGIEEAAGEYPGIKIVAKDSAKGLTPLAETVVEQWFAERREIDAICSTNDEMAIGAIRVLEKYDRLEDVMVLGIDATRDGINEVAAGKLTATVFQNSREIGEEFLDTAIKAVKKKNPSSEVWIPLQLVTSENYKEFLIKYRYFLKYY